MRLEEERRRLFERVANGAATACEWDAFLEVKRQLAPVLRRFSEDAKRYEWPPLATLFVTEGELPKEQILDNRNVPTFEELIGGGKFETTTKHEARVKGITKQAIKKMVKERVGG